MIQICPICTYKISIDRNENVFECPELHYSKYAYNNKFSSYYELMIYNGYFFDSDTSNNNTRIWKTNEKIYSLIEFQYKNHTQILNINNLIELKSFINLPDSQFLNKINFLKNFS